MKRLILPLAAAWVALLAATYAVSLLPGEDVDVSCSGGVLQDTWTDPSLVNLRCVTATPTPTPTPTPAPGNLITNGICQGTHGDPPPAPWTVVSGTWDVSVKSSNPSPGGYACRVKPPAQGGVGQGVLQQDLGAFTGGTLNYSMDYIAINLGHFNVDLLCDGVAYSLLATTTGNGGWGPYSTTVTLPSCVSLVIQYDGRFTAEWVGLKFTNAVLEP